MEPAPCVTAVVINWNTADLLGGCLRSIAGASGGMNVETIVVDNGSTDGSVAMVRRDFPGVTVIANERNEGFARAVNRAMERAAGPLVAIINSDAVLDADCLREMKAVFDGDERAAMVGARLLNADRTPQNSAANTPCLLTEVGKKALLKRLFPDRFYTRHFEPAGPTEVESLVGAAMMLRKTAMEELGAFDTGYFFFFEESDLCLRLRRAGWRVMLAPAARCVHLQGKSAGRVPVRARIEYWRSRYRFFRKHYHWLTRAALRAGLLVNLLVDVVYFALLSPFSEKARGRLRVCVAILCWHVALCPQGWGLSKPPGGEAA